ncbi:hypothetical protein C8J57DRAFT_1226122 [Mycena rebaudengoi]|nr:hypothetical protein C8J57DRAFT_1226122 [Mycena rebaudengoi]
MVNEKEEQAQPGASGTVHGRGGTRSGDCPVNNGHERGDRGHRDVEGTGRMRPEVRMGWKSLEHGKNRTGVSVGWDKCYGLGWEGPEREIEHGLSAAFWAAPKKAWQIAAAGQSVFSQRGLPKEENQNIMSSSCKIIFVYDQGAPDEKIPTWLKFWEIYQRNLPGAKFDAVSGNFTSFSGFPP